VWHKLEFGRACREEIAVDGKVGTRTHLYNQPDDESVRWLSRETGIPRETISKALAFWVIGPPRVSTTLGNYPPGQIRWLGPL